MAIVFDGPVLPDDLTMFVRKVPTPSTIRLNQFLPDRMVPYNRVDVARLTRTNRTARFRAYDAGPHVTKRDVGMVNTVMLPPVSDSLDTGELERLQLEFARTNGSNVNVFTDAIYTDGQNLTRYMQNRMELARGDVLLDGKFTLAGEGGLTIEADFGIPGGNFVTASPLWSDTANSDPLTDLFNWTYTYNVTVGNGFDPGGMVISRQTLTYLLSNTKLRTAAGTLLGAAQLLSRGQLDAALVDRGLPPILDVYDTQFDVDGTYTRVTPANKILFVPPDPGANLGYTAWGVSATALELVNSGRADLTFENAAGIVGVVDKSDSVPFRQKVIVDAVGMPIIENPYALFVATVS